MRAEGPPEIFWGYTKAELKKMRAKGAPENFWGYTKAETLKNRHFWEFGFGKK